jgi:uncharacterized protein
MTVELRPLGVRCNIGCQYCYQEPQRDAGNLSRRYDMTAMKSAIAQEGGPFSLFGGEPLLLPVADLDELWSWGFARYGSNGIQTNGTLVTETHVRLFKKYNVHVGVSIDGPDELNDVRWAGSLEKTRRATARTEQTIRVLCGEGIAPSLIVTLHRNNATLDKLPALFQWLRLLEDCGVQHLRLHLLEVESVAVREKYALSPAENLQAMTKLYLLQKELKKLRFDTFADMRRMLLGEDDRTTCVWTACDPYTTRAVRGVEGSGQRSNCGRTNKDGIDFAKADNSGFERYIGLYHTPQEFNGCKDCQFFLMCKGQCPGTAVDGDWRNRSEHCEVWKGLYGMIERELLESGRIPISRWGSRKRLERILLEGWAGGTNVPLFRALKSSGMRAKSR